MAKAVKNITPEIDSVYFLKILLYFIIGGGWIVLHGQKMIPVGLVAGVLIAQYERLQLDRKIEYSLLIVASLLGLFGLSLYRLVWS